LLREVSVYESFIELREQTSELEQASLDRVNQWRQIADIELSIAADFNRLVELQGDIILTLLAGKNRNSPEIAATLEAVTTTRNNMTVQTKQVENIRTKLQVL